MDSRVGINQLEEKVVPKEFDGEKPEQSPEELEKVKKELEAKQALEQEQARARGETIPEGKIQTSQFAEISTATARTLIQVKTALPFDPWPDKIIVDELKVSVIHIRFFGTEVVNSLLIKDVTDVTVSKVPFFASLQLTGGEYKGFPGGAENPLGALQANFLRHRDADLVRRIILGLIIFNDRKVDTSKMEINQLAKQAEELGRARK